MTKLRVSYYAHHFGSGHLRHAANVSRHPNFEVQVLSSREISPADVPIDFVHLGTDVEHGYQVPEEMPFHYVPVGENMQKRALQILTALDEFKPDIVIIDVSAEVAALAKIGGYPTLVRRMHGDRDDRAHRAMYDLADGIIAYYDESIEQDGIDPFLWAKTTYAGMLAPPQQSSVKACEGGVTVLTSLGANGVDLSALSEAARMTPDVPWRVVGHTHGELSANNVEVIGVVEHPERYLIGADLVVTSTGHNAVRAAVAARRPMVLVPEFREFREQERFAEAIHKRFGIPSVSTWANTNWADVLANAKRQKPTEVAEQMFVNDTEFFGALEAAVTTAIKR